MRRAFRILLIVLAAAFAALWVFGYLHISSLACAFDDVNSQTCRMKMPWDLRGDDLTILVLTPGAILAVLLLGIWLLRPKRRRT